MTYQTSLGSYDLAIAAPSMKAALEAWKQSLHQGVAKETHDPSGRRDPEETRCDPQAPRRIRRELRRAL
jgi:hypothetical protein